MLGTTQESLASSYAASSLAATVREAATSLFVGRNRVLLCELFWEKSATTNLYFCVNLTLTLTTFSEWSCSTPQRPPRPHPSTTPSTPPTASWIFIEMPTFLWTCWLLPSKVLLQWLTMAPLPPRVPRHLVS